jgi:hypothetical protein
MMRAPLQEVMYGLPTRLRVKENKGMGMFFTPDVVATQRSIVQANGLRRAAMERELQCVRWAASSFGGAW